MAVHLTRRDEFAVVTLDRPEALNALSDAVLDELSAAFDDAAASGARALLVTGAGDKAFCAGADIKELTGRPLDGDWARGGARPGRSSPSSTGCRSCRSPSSTASPWAAGSNWRSPAPSGLPPEARGWRCRRSSSASFRAMAERSACRVSSARRARSR